MVCKRLFGIVAISMIQMLPWCGKASAADWYVDGLNGNDSNSGSKAAPFLHPWRGQQAAEPGDTVHLLPTIAYPQFSITKSGRSGAPIVFKGDGNKKHRTQIRSDGTNFGIQVNPASYVIVEYFDVVAPGPWYGIYVGTGSHHVAILNNIVHDSGVGGIGTTGADYTNIVGNTVYSNSAYTATGIFGSGISTYENTDIDNKTGIKMVIARNVVFQNSNAPTSPGGTDPDGSGIILDDLRHTQSDGNAYKGQTLIENNIVYKNGGRGISLYSSDHAIIVNNTAYYNNQDPSESFWRPGEIGIGHSGDVQVYNNAAYSDGANCDRENTGCDVSISVTDGSGLPISLDYNLVYNAQANESLEYFLGGQQHGNSNPVTVGPNNLWGDPLFRNPQAGDFTLQPGSPGLSSANPSVAPPTDILKKPRPPQGPTEMAAFQQQ